VVSGKGDKVYLFLESENDKREDFLEGCLSFPGVFGTVKRWKEINVKYQVVGSRGDLVDRKDRLEGFEAIVFQHEFDHLDGVLFVDHIKKEKGKVYKQEGKERMKVEVDDILKTEN